MKVTRQNYERFLIDFMDGNLDPSMEASLFDFLDANPEIKAEFDDLDIIDTAVDDNISFEPKASLKKHQITSSKNIHEKNYEDFFIASTEGDLSKAEEKEVEEFVVLNPSLAKEQTLFNQTKVQPDLSIRYPHKKALKKYPFFVQKRGVLSVSAAASILLLISLFLFSKSDDSLTQTEYAQLEERRPVPIKMNGVIEKITINNSIEAHTLSYKTLDLPVLAERQDFLITDEKIRTLQARINTHEQLAALRPQFKPTRFILQRNFNFSPLQNTEQLNYANEDGKNKKVAKAIWNSLFTKNAIEVTGNSDIKKPKKVGTLWVLANIGLERVNEVTGTNMRLNSRADVGKTTKSEDNNDIERSRSSN